MQDTRLSARLPQEISRWFDPKLAGGSSAGPGRSLALGFLAAGVAMSTLAGTGFGSAR
jgi:hypothetical protein